VELVTCELGQGRSKAPIAHCAKRRRSAQRSR
jgi:hypothetical protein